MAWTQEARDKYRHKTKAERATARAEASSMPAQGKRELLKLVDERKAICAFPNTTLDEMFRGCGKTQHDSKLVAIAYVKLLSGEYEKLQQIAELWDGLTPGAQRKMSLDALCKQVDLPISEFIARVAPKAYEIGSNLSKMFVGLAQPQLVQKAVEYGMQEGNFKDRQMILQAGGTAPTPRGATINVTQQNANVNAGDSKLPDFSTDVIDLVEAIRD